jgi:hypothetical protein
MSPLHRGQVMIRSPYQGNTVVVASRFRGQHLRLPVTQHLERGGSFGWAEHQESTPVWADVIRGDVSARIAQEAPGEQVAWLTRFVRIFRDCDAEEVTSAPIEQF